MPSTVNMMIVSPSVVTDDSWYPDSGATNHITADSTAVPNSTTYDGQGNIIVGNGSTLPIARVVSNVISSTSKPLILRNMLHAPDITKTLLFVSQLCQDNNVKFEFLPHHCVVDLVAGQPLLQGIEQGGLYKLCLDSISECQPDASTKSSMNNVVLPYNVDCYAATTKSVSRSMGHQRVGHPSSDVLSHVLISCNASVLNTKSDYGLCHACSMGKSHKLPFTPFTTVYSFPLQLVQIDV